MVTWWCLEQKEMLLVQCAHFSLDVVVMNANLNFLLAEAPARPLLNNIANSYFKRRRET